MGVPDATTIRTAADFGAALKQVIGLSPDDVARRLSSNRRGPTAKRSRIYEVYNGTKPPSPQLLAALLQIAHTSKEEEVGWQRLLSGLSADTSESVIRVAAADPRLLGVHKSVEAANTTGSFPEYVVRDIDIDPSNGIRARIKRAANTGGFILLVGDSSVGKTRSAYEALLAELPDWFLLHPGAESGDLKRLLPNHRARLIVWLDEIDRYLDGPNRLTADLLRRLLQSRSPIVIIGTIWPKRYENYMSIPRNDEHSDPYRRERELLSIADVVSIGTTWSASEISRARQVAERDPRIRAAIEGESCLSSPPQILAAAPDIEARWDRCDPYAFAVIASCIDAVRLGHRSPVTAEFLRFAAVGYCDTSARAKAKENWFESALAHATEPLHGAAALLDPIAENEMGSISGYKVSDYLYQYASPGRRRSRIPSSTWTAIERFAWSAGDLARSAQSAKVRALYGIAVGLFDAADAAGSASAQLDRAIMLSKLGDQEALEALAHSGNEKATEWLLEELEYRNDIPALRRHVDAGADGALFRLCNCLRRAGDVNSLLQLAATGSTDAGVSLALIEADDGSLEGLRNLADSGNEEAEELLCDRLVFRREEGELRCRAASGSEHAGDALLYFLSLNDRTDELWSLVAAGNLDAEEALTTKLIKEGHVEQLQSMADRATDATNRRRALHAIEVIRQEEVRRRARAGDAEALAQLPFTVEDRMWALLPHIPSDLVQRALEGDEAAVQTTGRIIHISALALRADYGSQWAESALGKELVISGDVDSLFEELGAGASHAVHHVCEALIARGDQTAASNLTNYGLNADYTIADSRTW